MERRRRKAVSRACARVSARDRRGCEPGRKGGLQQASSSFTKCSKEPRLLSNGTAKSSKNRSTAHLLWESRSSRFRAGLCLGLPGVRFLGGGGGGLAR